MEIPKSIKEQIKNTVGYAEAANKNLFMVGADVAFSKSEDYYKPQVDYMQREIERYKSDYEEVREDMRTLVSIIAKYTGNNIDNL